MTPIVSYLKEGKLPEGKDEARKLNVRVAKYLLMDEVLYKRGFSQPYLRCLAQMRRTMCWGRFMKEHVEITREPDPSSTRSSVQDTTGQQSKQMRRFMSRCVTNANDLVTFQGNHQSISPQWWPVAFCAMGSRHLRSFSSQNQTDEVSSGEHWLFHQMSGGWTISKYHTTDC